MCLLTGSQRATKQSCGGWANRSDLLARLPCPAASTHRISYAPQQRVRGQELVHAHLQLAACGEQEENQALLLVVQSQPLPPLAVGQQEGAPQVVCQVLVLHHHLQVRVDIRQMLKRTNAYGLACECALGAAHTVGMRPRLTRRSSLPASVGSLASSRRPASTFSATKPV